MMKLFLFLTLIFISLFMFFLKHPLSMGLMIMIQTLCICLMSGLIISTYWYSYILFLTFLGGLLVLFIYVSSIASNELFNIKIKNKFLLFMSIFFIMNFSIMFMYNLKWMNFSTNFEDMNKIFNLMINNENNISLTKLYNNQNYFLMIMLIIYLFITLIAVVKITNIFYGPLRSF